MCVNIQCDPLKFLTNILWPGLSGQMRYLRDPGPRITELTEAMSRLKAKSEDINDEIFFAKRRGETPTHEVQDLLRKVDAINDKVSKIQTDHENGTFRWFINRRVEKRLAKVIALVNDSRFDTVATRRPPNGVQEIPAELPPDNPTMVSYLSQLRDFLQDDKSPIFGIWGMGGVGKTTLLIKLNNELARNAQPVFDHVIFAVASKDDNKEKLQCDISKWLGLTPCEDRTQQVQIWDFLKDKSFLLLLDDLYRRVELADLGIPQLNGTKKQKVVFTTRLEGVCGEMQAWRIMKVDCLKEEEAWQLFQNKVCYSNICHFIFKHLFKVITV